MLSCTTNVETPELKGLGFNRCPALNNHQTFYRSLHGILALSREKHGSRAWIWIKLWSSSEFNKPSGWDVAQGEEKEVPQVMFNIYSLQALPSIRAGPLPAANTSNVASPRTPTELSRSFPVSWDHLLQAAHNGVEISGNQNKDGWWGRMCSYNPAKTVIYPSYVLGICRSESRVGSQNIARFPTSFF